MAPQAKMPSFDALSDPPSAITLPLQKFFLLSYLPINNNKIMRFSTSENWAKALNTGNWWFQTYCLKIRQCECSNTVSNCNYGDWFYWPSVCLVEDVMIFHQSTLEYYVVWFLFITSLWSIITYCPASKAQIWRKNQEQKGEFLCYSLIFYRVSCSCSIRCIISSSFSLPLFLFLFIPTMHQKLKNTRLSQHLILLNNSINQ